MKLIETEPVYGSIPNLKEVITKVKVEPNKRTLRSNASDKKKEDSETFLVNHKLDIKDEADIKAETPDCEPEVAEKGANTKKRKKKILVC